RTVNAEASVFRTAVDGFIYYAPLVDARTGLPQRDPRLRRYVVYQAAQAPAELLGAEGRVQVEPVRGWVADGTVSWVRGTRTDVDEPLPAMPPLRGRLQLRRETPRWLLGVGADVIGAQSRVPPAPTGAGATCTVSRGIEDESRTRRRCSRPSSARPTAPCSGTRPPACAARGAGGCTPSRWCSTTPATRSGATISGAPSRSRRNPGATCASSTG
ncbi:MAG: TonB-dependent receptor, partial [Gemmatimonadaceae bacterium]|nr:TonB-dependent receptor [Gemmatimonadaceae bacterium]